MVTTDSLASFCVFHVFYTLVNSFNLMKQKKVDIRLHRVCVFVSPSCVWLLAWLVDVREEQAESTWKNIRGHQKQA